MSLWPGWASLVVPRAGYLGFDDEEGGDGRKFKLNLCLGRTRKGSIG